MAGDVAQESFIDRGGRGEQDGVARARELEACWGAEKHHDAGVEAADRGEPGRFGRWDLGEEERSHLDYGGYDNLNDDFCVLGMVSE